MKEEEIRQYLSTLSSLESLEGASILDLRDQVLRGKEKPASPFSIEDWNHLPQSAKLFLSRFWTMEQKDFEGEIQIWKEKFPHHILWPKIEKIFLLRKKILAFSKDSKIYPPFQKAYIDILSFSPLSAAPIRKEIWEALLKEEHRSKIHASLMRMMWRYYSLYSMEKPWLRALHSYKNKSFFWTLFQWYQDLYEIFSLFVRGAITILLLLLAFVVLGAAFRILLGS